MTVASYAELLKCVTLRSWCKMRGGTAGLAYLFGAGIVYMRDGSFLVCRTG